MVPDAISIGPLVLPPIVVPIAVAFVALAIAARFVPIEEENRLLQNGALAFLLGWKLTPVVLAPQLILADPLAAFRVPGGVAGTLVGAAAALVVVVLAFRRAQTVTPPRFVTAILIAASTGAIAWGALAAASPSPAIGGAGLLERIAAAPALDSAGALADGPAFSTRDGATDRPVVLTAWATWCGPCRADHPAKGAAIDRFGSRVHFVGVNLTTSEANEATVARYVADHLPYGTVLDRTGAIGSALGVLGTPTTIVLDSNGDIVARWMGPSSADRVARAIEVALASSD